MLGAVIGDIVGSRFECFTHKNCPLDAFYFAQCPFFSAPNVDPRISADGTRYCAWRKWSTGYWVKERKINEVIALFSNVVSEKI